MKDYSSHILGTTESWQAKGVFLPEVVLLLPFSPPPPPCLLPSSSSLPPFSLPPCLLSPSMLCTLWNPGLPEDFPLPPSSPFPWGIVNEAERFALNPTLAFSEPACESVPPFSFRFGEWKAERWLWLRLFWCLFFCGPSALVSLVVLLSPVGAFLCGDLLWARSVFPDLLTAVRLLLLSSPFTLLLEVSVQTESQ